MIGQKLNHYKILSRLGKGGMGEVYAAEDTKLDRKVALKILPAEMSSDPVRLDRFAREAKAVAALSHPNIVTIHSVEESGDRHFLIMELVSGKTLAQAIPQRGFELTEFLPIAVRIADALTAAHEKGIIHRDLKPANIMVGEEGRVKILDFGLAKSRNPTPDTDASQLETSTKTEAGVVMGTLPYMSPEQVQGMAVDHRTDIFSLGIVFYEMLSGSRPFAGESTAGLVSSILRDTPLSITSLKPEFPRDLERMIQRCLEKDVRKRYQSAYDIKLGLEALQKDIDSHRKERGRKHETPAHNLPIQLTTFVGRTEELKHIKGLLQSHPLVTLVGSGGSGKTRLALQAAAEMIQDYIDGVWLVDLVPLTDSAFVPNFVASAVRVTEVPGMPMIDTLCEQLVEKNLLLVLDNCEHVVEGCCTLADRLLHKIPGLRILATSQAALGVGGEIAWRVPSLSLPDPTSPPGEMRGFEAIQLFLDRAVANQPKFALTDQNAPVIAQICHRLDGIPLAIELAAARVKVLSPAEILNRLEDRFRLLVGGSRTAVPRQQTLRAAVGWSHDLLCESERILFRRLSIFSGGFTLPAAEQVCRGDDLAGEDILDLLSQLVEKSLVIADTEQDGSIRYRMLETFRQYGHEKRAAANEEHRAADAHLRFFLDFAEQAYAGRMDESALWLNQLEREHDNLRAALDWSRDRYPDLELQLAGALAWFWYRHTNHLTEGLRHLAHALETRSATDAPTARALCGAALIANWQGDAVSASTLAEESLQMWKELDNPFETALALEALGWSYCWRSDNERALPLMEESLSIMERTGSKRSANQARVAIAQVLVALGDVDRAEKLAGETLAIGRELNEPRDIHYCLHFLGDCELYRGNGLEAERRYSESLQAALDYGNIVEAAMEMQGLAMGLAAQGRLQKAFRLTAAADAKIKALGLDYTGIRFWMDFKERYLEASRQTIGVDAAAEYESEGRNMKFEAAVRYALDLNLD